MPDVEYSIASQIDLRFDANVDPVERDRMLSLMSKIFVQGPERLLNVAWAALRNFQL